MFVPRQGISLRFLQHSLQTPRATSSRYVGVVIERRTTRRFRVKLPLRVRWATKSGNGEVHTESEDISSRGVYFFLPTRIKKGSWVELVLVLPREITLTEPVLVRCQARVQRTEIKKRNRIGVAAQIEIYQILAKTRTLAPRLQIPSDTREKQNDLAQRE